MPSLMSWKKMEEVRETERDVLHILLDQLKPRGVVSIPAL